MKYLYTTGCSFAVGCELDDITKTSTISKDAFSSRLADMMGYDELIVDAKASSTNLGILRRLASSMPRLLSLIEDGHTVVVLINWTHDLRMEIPLSVNTWGVNYMERDRYTISPTWYTNEIDYDGLSEAEQKEKAKAKDAMFTHLFGEYELGRMFFDQVEICDAMLMGRMPFFFTSAFENARPDNEHFILKTSLNRLLYDMDSKMPLGHPTVEVHQRFAEMIYEEIKDVV